jgi:hypothetical protein
LREENREKSKNLNKLGKLVEKKDSQISELQQEIQQLKINLEKANKTIEKKESETSDLHLSNKKLAKAEEEIKTLEKRIYYSIEKDLPLLPKKQNKSKLLGKAKIKYQQFKQFIKKEKVQEQKSELVARIEVKVN